MAGVNLISSPLCSNDPLDLEKGTPVNVEAAARLTVGSTSERNGVQGSEEECEESPLLSQGNSRANSQDSNPSRSAASAVDHLLSRAPDLDRARFLLYTSHALSTWGQRMWEFAVGLILLELHPRSLVWVAAFGLVDSLTSVCFGTWVGSCIDRWPRYRAACVMYLIQNIFVALSASTALLAFALSATSPMFVLSNFATITAASVSTLGALGSTMSIEKDWVKALHKEDSDGLAHTNAGMRRIDLTCLIASPIVAGFLMTYGGMRITTLAIVTWNLTAWAPEFMLLSRAQYHAPLLRESKTTESHMQPTSEQTASFQGLLGAWKVYMRQTVSLAALALALLYLTVLSLGLLMTAYLKSLGMSEARLSLFRGLGAASGIAATFTFPWFHTRQGLDITGLFGILCQCGCLLAAILPALWDMVVFHLSHEAVTYALVCGLAASRFGLWTFDLSVSQMLQARVVDEELGVVNGVQGSLQSFFGSLSYAAGLFVWQPEHFPWLMLGSWCAVLFAAGIYVVFLNSRQGQAVAPHEGTLPANTAKSVLPMLAHKQAGSVVDEATGSE